MADHAPGLWDLQITEDPAVQQDWGNLIAILGQNANFKSTNKALIDQLVLELALNWLTRYDKCGVVEDLVDIALYNSQGQTLNELVNEEMSGFLPPETDIDAALPNGGRESLVARPSTATDAPKTGDRRLSFFTETQCTTFDSTMMLGSMLSFTSCAEVDIGSLLGGFNENIANVALECINTFLSPLERSQSCASTDFRGYILDQCISSVVKDNVLGDLFKLFLVKPKQTCGCMKSLSNVPLCRLSISEDVAIDGLMTSKVACMLETQICDKLEDECDARLEVLNQCLPNLFDLSNDNFDCQEVMCGCEKMDGSLINYPGRAMELPMADMCEDHAVQNFMGDFVVERYGVFQEKCGASFLNPPSAAPSSPPSDMPSSAPTMVDNPLIARISQQNDSLANVAVSGTLFALAFIAIVALVSVCLLVCWRRRCMSAGYQVKDVDQVKTEDELNEEWHKDVPELDDSPAPSFDIIIDDKQSKFEI